MQSDIATDDAEEMVTDKEVISYQEFKFWKTLISAREKRFQPRTWRLVTRRYGCVTISGVDKYLSPL